MNKSSKANNVVNVTLIVGGIIASVAYIYLVNSLTVEEELYVLTYIPLVLLAIVYGLGFYKYGKSKSPEFAKASLPITIVVLLLFIYSYLNSSFYF